MAFVLFLPESPRWLYAQGKTDKAVQVLANLHSRTKDVNSPLVRMEIGEIEESIEIGGERGWWDPRPLFNTRSQLIRFGMGMLDAVFQTLAGNGLVTCELHVLLPGEFLDERRQISSLHCWVTLVSNRQMSRGCKFFCPYSGLTSQFECGQHHHFGIWSHLRLATYRPHRAETSHAILRSGDDVHHGYHSGHSERHHSDKRSQTTSRHRLHLYVPHNHSRRSELELIGAVIFMSMYSVSWTPITGVYPTECFAYTTRAKGLAYWQFIQAGLACISKSRSPFLADFQIRLPFLSVLPT